MRNNSSKTGLFLMELIIAILFFSLAGAVCIQLFVRSHIISNKSVELNHSVLWVQNVAETFYGCNGDINQMSDLLGHCIVTEKNDAQQLLMLFDEEFNPIEIEPAALAKDFNPAFYTCSYSLQADITREANLTVCNIVMENKKDAEPVYSLSISLFPDKEVLNEQ